MSLKNLWSLNIDEALAADRIKTELRRQYEVFFPTNAQLKNIDLILFNLSTKRSRTIQVKGSRTYEPRKAEVNRYGGGRSAWVTINRDQILKTKNEIDFFVIVLHSLVDSKTRKEIQNDFLVVPAREMRKIVRKKKVRRGGKYHFFIWIDPQNKRSFDFNNSERRQINLKSFLNNWALLTR